MPRVEYRVSGRVQGVGFRWFCVHAAERLGVRGYARNLPDGSVEVVADAPDEVLTQLEAELTVGPRASRVTGVERRPARTDDAFDGFEIR